MKRLLGIVLAVCFIFAVAGCDEKEESKSTAGVDLEYYSRYGQIPECEFAIGQDVDELINTFESRTASEEAESGEEHDHDGFFYTPVEHEEYTALHTGTVEYIYKEESKESGISCIVSYSDAYEFPLGTVSVEIEAAFSDFDNSRSDTENAEIFFMSGGEFTCLKYTFEKNDIVFVFADNALCATAIYDNTQWEI